MLKRSVLACLAAFSLAIAGCDAARKPTSTSNFDPSVDFSSYKTYRMFQEPLIAVDEERPNELVISTIETSLRKTLASKGYVPATENADADFSVGYTVGVAKSVKTLTMPDGYRSAFDSGWANSYYSPVQYVERNAILAIHVFDVAEKRAAYGTTGTKKLPPNYDRNDVSQIPGAIEALLSDFPPE